MKTVDRETPEGPILEIHMQGGEVTCWICAAETEHRWGVPVFNGDLVSNDFPDWLVEGGQAVCESCYGKHERGELRTFDAWYIHHAKTFINGDGI